MPSPSKQQAAAARRAKIEQIKREQRAASLRRRLLIVGGVVVAGAVVAAVVVGVATSQPKAAADAAGDQIIPAGVTGATTTQQPPSPIPDTSGIDEVLAWDTEGWPGDGAAHPGALQHDHVAGPVAYQLTPPVGGPHNSIWMNAGVYTKPVPPERAVHNLEHGAVWITYDPDLPTAQVKSLTAFVTKQSFIGEQEQASNGQALVGQANRYIDLSPWSSNTLPTPIVISAWGHQLRLTSPTDPRLQQFVDTFRHNPKYTPEYGAAVDGIPVQTGGRPALDGSKIANPAGSAP